MIGRQQEKKNPDQGSEESKRKINRKIVGPYNFFLCLHLFRVTLNQKKRRKEKAKTP